MSNPMQIIGQGVGLGFEAAFRAKAEAAYKQGISLLQQGKADAAIACFTEALRHAPSFLQARLMRAGAFASQGRFSEAVDESTKILEEDPANADAMHLRGSVLEVWSQQSGDSAMLERSQEDLTEACRLNPELLESLAEREDQPQAKAQPGAPPKKGKGFFGRLGDVVMNALWTFDGEKICNFCGTTIPSIAVICPNCRSRLDSEGCTYPDHYRRH